MSKVELPRQLKQLFERSELEAPLLALVDKVSIILADNKLAFFPDYTDHGIDHTNCVLRSEVGLIPNVVWEKSTNDSYPRLLCDIDVVMLVGATLLHDLGMHLTPSGFLELISPDSRFRPLTWFNDRHEGHSPDIEWNSLWLEFDREARRFSTRELANIVGEPSALSWKYNGLPENPAEWQRNHHLIVGEFVRRHHPRLAHEIAIYGFPGIPVGSGAGQFPAMGQEGHALADWADLIGLIARSHGLSLRVCKDYLNFHHAYRDNPRPMGSAVFYPMALLRVADYFQIDRRRAPAVLLKLRNPQSTTSVQEWLKHSVVRHIGAAADPRGKMITVGADLSLSLYLQLRALLDALQSELDHSTAVLDEVYGTQTEIGLNQLNLAVRRIYSNLYSPAYLDSLPYIPDDTGFSSDPKLLSLLVGPLYGLYPGVAVRELMQNAADAVRELEAWCATRGMDIQSLELHEQEQEILVEFVRREDGSWFLRVQDKGIGMKADTIRNYFLRAGASFRSSSDWIKEFVDRQGRSRVTRAGRFGIGVFAIFLLGPSFRMWTRHVSSEKSEGYAIDATANSHLIEVTRVDNLRIGTAIEVEISSEAADLLQLGRRSDHKFVGLATDWFCWEWPRIAKRLLREGVSYELKQEYSLPVTNSELPPEWCVIKPEGYDSIYWTFANAPALSCNGLRVASPEAVGLSDAQFSWPEEKIDLAAPNIALEDRNGKLPLTIQRYRLSRETLPFLDHLVTDVVLSFIAHSLIYGPASCDEALETLRRHPLQTRNLEGMLGAELFSFGRLRWCATGTEAVPADAALFPLLKADSYIVWGTLSSKSGVSRRQLFRENVPTLAAIPILEGHSVLSSPTTRDFDTQTTAILTELLEQGAGALSDKFVSSKVLVSVAPYLDFGTSTTMDRPRKPSVWRRIIHSEYSRRWFEASTNTRATTPSLSALITSVESDFYGIIYAAEVKLKTEKSSSPSHLARLWNECLGPNPMPFDMSARNELILRGSEHPGLKRHIDAWRRMRHDGSIIKQA
jgi:hypothetical protein